MCEHKRRSLVYNGSVFLSGLVCPQDVGLMCVLHRRVKTTSFNWAGNNHARWRGLLVFQGTAHSAMTIELVIA